jgi:hypothetical protein
VSKGRQPSEYGDSENQRREEEERATSGPTPPNKHANVVTISRTSAQIPSRPSPPSSRIRHQHLTRVCLRPVPHRKSTTKLTIYPPLHLSLQSHHPHSPLSLLSPFHPQPSPSPHQPRNVSIHLHPRRFPNCHAMVPHGPRIRNLRLRRSHCLTNFLPRHEWREERVRRVCERCGGVEG